MSVSKCLAIASLFIAARLFGADSGYFTNGELVIVSSSHQDTAWMDTPAACRKFRIEQNILPAMEMMRKDTNYTFCIECTLHLMEFLDARPEMRDEVVRRMKEGRLEFGATYNQPYESWLSGEELVRETYYGRGWIKKNLPGCDAKVAFNPDPPARSLQMQQILAKAGIPYMFISRYHEGLYRWASPDGSSVLLYTPGHYGTHQPLLNGPTDRCVSAIERKLEQQGASYRQHQIPPVFCLINSQDFSKPSDFIPLIQAWNAHSQASSMKYSSIAGFFRTIDKPAAEFATLMGERPDVWVYITGPTHHWTASAKREAARLLPAAETFTTFACLLDGSFRDWPAAEFESAWQNEIYMDHGIGGNNGHITDEVFRRKIESARDSGRALLDKALKAIASRVKANPNRGEPLTVFNTLSWARTQPVDLEVAGPVHIVGAEGIEVPCQFTTLGSPDEVNVATNGKATASSVFSAEYGPEKAIDGRWDVRDPNPETGSSSKWNSARGATGPHWLAIDFDETRTIHKVVIRHEGVIGAFGGETRYNTADFQVQAGETATGPWSELVPPVTNNTDSLTVHTFAPKIVRHLRIYITKGAQTDSTARLYEVQAFEQKPPARRLVFVAKDVPPLGYKTYYLAPGAPAPGPTKLLENEFYKVALAPGGIQSLFDKQQNRELLDTSKFLGGEVFTELSVAPNNRGRGTDAGEFGSVPLPVMDASFDRIANHKPQWSLIESGPVRTVYQLEQPLPDTTARQRVVLWHGIKRVDCEVDLANFNGRLWREFRMALPLAMEKPKLVYEVPMGVVEIGKDEIPTTGGYAYGNLTYADQCRDIHPRMMQNFVDASDSRGGLMMSSSVSVFDWSDATNRPILQPILLASRKSCNGAGVWYPQAGDHTYRFSLTSHPGDWRANWRDGIAANYPLMPVWAKQASGATLPESLSFASLDAGNVVVSTIKKAEDSDRVIVRAYDIEGRDAVAGLRLFWPVVRAQRTDLLEEGGSPLNVRSGVVEFPIGHHAIETSALDWKD